MAIPTFIDQANSSLFHNANQTPWLIAFSGKLYAFLVSQLGVVNGNNPHFYKSTNNGDSWVELDAVNAPANVGDAFVCWDTNNSRAIVCFNTRTAATTPLQLTQFNLSTETWGPAITAGGPNAARTASVWGVFLRPDTTIAVIFDSGVSGAGDSRLHGVFWNGAVWSAPIDLGVNMPFNSGSAPACIVQPCSCSMDTTGLIHLFPVGVGAGLHNYWGYQQWKTDNTLGFFNVFGTGAAFNDSRGTQMVISGDVLILGILSNPGQRVMNIFRGTPIVNPVWTQTVPAVLTVGASSIPSPFSSLAVFNGNCKAFSFGNVSLSGGASIAAYSLNLENLTAAGRLVVMQLTQADLLAGNIYEQLVTSTDDGLTWTILPSDVAPNYNYYLGFSPVDPAVDIWPTSFLGTLIASLQLVAGAGGRGGGLGGILNGPGGSGGITGIMNKDICVGGVPRRVRRVRVVDRPHYRREGVEEWPFTWAKRYVIPAPTTDIPILRHQPFVITDADFVMRAYMVDTSLNNQADFQGMSPFDQNPFRMAIYRTDESLIHANNRATFGRGYSSIVPIVESGTARTPMPVIPELYLIRDSSLYVDLSNDFNNVATPVELALKGVKLFPKGTHYSPPAGHFTLLPFDYHFLLQSLGPMTAGTPFTGFLPLDSDSDFCLQAIDCGPLVGLSIQVFGANGVEPLSNALVTIGNFCGSQAFPSALCAPVFYPPDGQIKFLFYVPNPAPTMVTASPGEGNPGYITFRGMKMFRRK